MRTGKQRQFAPAPDERIWSDQRSARSYGAVHGDRAGRRNQAAHAGQRGRCRGRADHDHSLAGCGRYDPADLRRAGRVPVMAGASFLGRGWRFPIQPDASGGLGYVEGDANIEQSLRVLLMTELGERVMRATFGCDAPRLVFSPGSVQYLQLLETTVREAVRDWEPRVTLEGVTAEAIP